MKKKSFFVVLEGPDGTGKSTIRDKVIKRMSMLKEFKGYNIFKTFEPGKTRTGSRIRKVLLDNETIPSPMSELFLYLADRADHYDKFLKPLLKNDGNIIVSDRFFESTFIYQCLTRKVISFEEFSRLHEVILKDLKPDLTIVLNSESPHSLKGDRLDEETKEFKQGIRRNYERIKEFQNFFDYPIHYIDTTKQNWEEYIEDIVGNILNLLVQK